MSTPNNTALQMVQVAHLRCGGTKIKVLWQTFQLNHYQPVKKKARINGKFEIQQKWSAALPSTLVTWVQTLGLVYRQFRFMAKMGGSVHPKQLSHVKVIQAACLQHDTKNRKNEY